MDVTEFLLARIAEEGTSAVWRVGRHYGIHVYEDDRPVATFLTPEDAAMAVSDRRRALAEREAKRKIVELHEIVTVDYAGQWWTDPAPPGTYVRTGCHHCTHAGVDGDEYVDDGPCMTLRLLALPYAHHPDYRQEWDAAYVA